MFRQTRPRRLLSLLALGMITLIGCDGPSNGGVPLKGKVILPQGLKLNENDSLEIRLVPNSESDPAAIATVNGSELDSFSFSQAGEPFVLPGTYNVGARISLYEEGDGQMSAAIEDFNANHEPKSSGMTVTVNEGGDGEQTITIDLENQSAK